MMRSSVWQPVQLSRNRFWSSVPGMLISHSALVRVAGEIFDLLELDLGLGFLAGGHVGGRSRRRAHSRPHAPSTCSGRARADPPGRRSGPWASLTTLMLIVEPSFLALTTTPSIAPSSADVTWPVKAAGVWACVGKVNGPAASRNPAATVVPTSRRSLIRIAFSPLAHPYFPKPGIRSYSLILVRAG